MVALGADVDILSGIADSGGFADDLAALFEIVGETSRELGIGTLILVDELQEATGEEFVAVNTAVHQLGQDADPMPVACVAGGLPSLPAQLADATSYAERLYEYRPIGLLRDEAAQDALLASSHDLGVDWDDDALAAALAVAAATHTSCKPSVNTSGTRRGQALSLLMTLGLVANWPAARSSKATGKRRVSDLSVARNELIKKGLVYAPERGLLAFTVPGMSEFIVRQP